MREEPDAIVLGARILERAVGALRADIAGRDAQIQIDPLPSVPAAAASKRNLTSSAS